MSSKLELRKLRKNGFNAQTLKCRYGKKGREEVRHLEETASLDIKTVSASLFQEASRPRISDILPVFFATPSVFHFFGFFVFIALVSTIHLKICCLQFLFPATPQKMEACTTNPNSFNLHEKVPSKQVTTSPSLPDVSSSVLMLPCQSCPGHERALDTSGFALSIRSRFLLITRKDHMSNRRTEHIASIMPAYCPK